jgi:hypothetical protein
MKKCKHAWINCWKGTEEFFKKHGTIDGEPDYLCMNCGILKSELDEKDTRKPVNIRVAKITNKPQPKIPEPKRFKARKN